MRYGRACFIANLISFLACYAMSAVVVYLLISTVVIRIMLWIVLFFLCGFFEEKVLSRLVNQLVERIIGIE